jgi:tRNA (cmo5U34)-methyltransferase
VARSTDGGELVGDFAAEGTDIYDLGCSTCNTFLHIEKNIPEEMKVRFVGVDSSPEMLEKAREKLATAGFKRDFVLHCADLNQGVPVSNASVALMLLTLQFVRPLYRDRLIRQIYRGLEEQVLIRSRRSSARTRPSTACSSSTTTR